MKMSERELKIAKTDLADGWVKKEVLNWPGDSSVCYTNQPTRELTDMFYPQPIAIGDAFSGVRLIRRLVLLR